jgi:hypothetical protein
VQWEQENPGVEEGEDLQREIGVEMMSKQILRKLLRKEAIGQGGQ